MPSKTVVVGSSVGLHARPAALIAEAAEGLGSEVTLAAMRRIARVQCVMVDHDRHGRPRQQRALLRQDFQRRDHPDVPVQMACERLDGIETLRQTHIRANWTV